MVADACSTVNALNKINRDFSKGAFCSCEYSGLVFSCTSGSEERRGVYEENDDVEDMIGRLSRPFLTLC